MTKARVLIVDDDASMLDLIREALARGAFEPRSTTSPAEALEILGREAIDVVVTDLNMQELGGLELCERVVSMQPDLPVLVITAFGSMETAIGAIRAGAYDYVTKPFEMEDLLHAVSRAAQHRSLHNEVKRLRELVKSSARVDTMIGDSVAMKKVFEVIQRVADTEMTVLISGESGTGKELVARALHDQSRRANGPFVALNCAALPATLLESELFGHVKGSFTGAGATRVGLLQQATGGSLFLDEVGEMPLEMQAKLLRALQERKVRPVGGGEELSFDARILAASNRDLETEVEEGRFREELFYRINVVRIDMPPLRARGSDILLLAQSFVDDAAPRTGKPVHGISSPAAEKLLGYDWPGNVRELQNTMQRAVALTQYELIVIDDLPEKIRNYTSSSLTLVASDDPSVLLPMAEVERRYIQSVLKAVRGNKTGAARILGFDRRTLYRKLERFGISAGVGAGTR